MKHDSGDAIDLGKLNEILSSISPALHKTSIYYSRAQDVQIHSLTE